MHEGNTKVLGEGVGVTGNGARDVSCHGVLVERLDKVLAIRVLAGIVVSKPCFMLEYSKEMFKDRNLRGSSNPASPQIVTPT